MLNTDKINGQTDGGVWDSTMSYDRFHAINEEAKAYAMLPRNDWSEFTSLDRIVAN